MAKEELKKDEGAHAVLFPHSGLTEEGLEKILSFFGHLTLFLPWHMQGPQIREGERVSLRVSHPPESMKPVPDFKSLLSEYKGWMTYNDLKGYSPLLRANLAKPPPPDVPTTAELRQEIRARESGRDPRVQDPFTGWHLLLHLNRQMEEREEEASRVLTALKLAGSPLKEAVGEETDAGLLDDLPPFDAGSPQEPHALDRVCEAWFGLFGESLRRRDLLLTRNRHLYAHLSGLWEECFGDDRGAEHSVDWLWPDLSGIDLDALARERENVFQDGRARGVSRAILDFQNDPDSGFSELRKASQALDPFWVQRYSPKILKFSMRVFPRPPEAPRDPMGRALANVLDRVIVLVEEAAGHESA